MATTVAVATCTQPSRPDEDLAPLCSALLAQGLVAQPVAWDDAAVLWEAFDVVLIRSTWNYIHHFEAFQAWVDRVAERAVLINPPRVLRWNWHKGYLEALAEAGLPVIETRVLRRGSAAHAPALEAVARWSDIVIKPAVSAGSFATVRVGDVSAAERHLAQHLPERDMLIQPYQPSVARQGESALVHIEGRFSHAVTKRARFADDEQAVVPQSQVPEDELVVARRILNWVEGRFGGPLLYARVDLARDAEGAPLLMELELIEPDLFLRTAPTALDRLVAALQRRLGGRPPAL